MGHTIEDSAAESRGSIQGQLVGWIRSAAATRLPVLVTGESGSGKEAVARAVHLWSERATGPFIAVNSGAFTESLLEAELFGVVRGAFTGADRDRPGLFRTAHGGTLFLDEIGDTPPGMQVRLLRAIEERVVRPVGGRDEIAVDTRIVAATHRDLVRDTALGRFRADLYYRLAVVEIRVPPLRERLDELEALIERMSRRLRIETGLGPVSLTPDAWEALRRYSWPGNVRELHTILARALLRSGGGAIRPEHLALPAAETRSMRSLEGRMIESSLSAAGGNVTAAARQVGWSRQKLYRRAEALGIDVARFRTGRQSLDDTDSSGSSTFQ